jgi:sorbose reductase
MSLNPLEGGNFIHAVAQRTEASPLLKRFSLIGKTAIVTGAGAGIGLAVAQGLAEMGANVAIWYNTNTKAVERASEIEAKYGVRCMIPIQQYMRIISDMLFRQGVPGQHSRCGGSASSGR